MNQDNQELKIVIGNAVFRQTLNQKQPKYQELIITLNQKQWQINSIKYQQQKWHHIFLLMNESSVQHLRLSNISNSKIIKQIQNVYFSNLKSLSLNDNFIQNIQALTFINCTNLQYLGLSSNRITNLKSFNKLPIQTLDKMSINKNPLIQITSMIKSKMNPHKLKILFFQQQKQYQSSHSNDHPIILDLSFMVKLSSPSIKQLYIRSNGKIRQPKIWGMLELRFVYIYFDYLQNYN